MIYELNGKKYVLIRTDMPGTCVSCVFEDGPCPNSGNLAEFPGFDNCGSEHDGVDEYIYVEDTPENRVQAFIDKVVKK